MIRNKYDPRLKKYDELDKTFTCGENILKELLNEFKPGKNKKKSNQSWIITGPRGAGKTHLLALLYRKIIADRSLSDCWYPLIFPEELFDVDSLYRLLLRIFENLFKNNDSKELEEQRLEFHRLKKIRVKGNLEKKREEKHRLSKALFELLVEVKKVTGKKFILMLENLQYIFKNQLSIVDLKHLRGFISENPDVFIILGTALSIFGEIENYGRPFYHFFRIRSIDSLDKKGVMNLLFKIASFRKESSINIKIEDNRHYIDVYRLLTGGNPRLILFLYELLLDNERLNTDMILEKITELTPYFIDKTRDESSQRKLILNALATETPAQTATEIAEYINEDQKSISEQLKRLVAEGWVREIPINADGVKQREVFYSLRDYFYRIWYKVRMKGIDESDIFCLAELAAILFGREEIEERVKNFSELQSEKRLLFEKSLELVRNKKFTKNIKILLKEAKESESKEVKVLLEEITDCYEKCDWERLINTAKKMLDYPEIKGAGHSHLKIGKAKMADITADEDTATLTNLQKTVDLKTEHENAIEKYKEKVVDNPNDNKAWFDMGVSYLRLDNYEKAIECLQRSVNLVPNNHEAWFYKGVSHVNLNDYENAIKCYEMAISVEPASSNGWHNLGIVYSRKGERERAIECWQKAVEIKPEKHESWYNMGVDYFAMGNYKKAIKYLQKTVDINEYKLDAWHKLGIVKGCIKKHEEAIECYEKAVEINPFNYESWFNMGVSYFYLSNYEKVIECYRKVVSIKPDINEAWYNMGNAYYMLNNYADSYDSYSKFIRYTLKFNETDFFKIAQLKTIAASIFNSSGELKHLLDKKSTIESRMESLCRLLLMGKFIAVTDSFDLILKEKELPKYEVKKLEFSLESYILDILSNGEEKGEVKILMKYWILLLNKTSDLKTIKNKFLEFVYQYIKFAGKKNVSLKVIEDIMGQLYSEGIEISDIIIKIVRAVKNPNTREAQTWMADPLFAEIVKQLS